MRARIFKYGNSLAVRIPKEFGFCEAGQNMEIERQGDSLIVRPLRQGSLEGVMAAFAAFPEDFMANGREKH